MVNHIPQVLIIWLALQLTFWTQWQDFIFIPNKLNHVSIGLVQLVEITLRKKCAMLSSSRLSIPSSFMSSIDVVTMHSTCLSKSLTSMWNKTCPRSTRCSESITKHFPDVWVQTATNTPNSCNLAHISSIRKCIFKQVNGYVNFGTSSQWDYYSVLKRKELWIHKKIWKNLKCILPDERRKSEKATHTVLFQLYEILWKTKYGDNKKISGCQRWGGKRDDRQSIEDF